MIHEARLRERDKDGYEWRTHLQKRVERGIAPEADLLGPDIPEALEYFWGWLLELDRMREIGMAGPAPFTPQMIESWARQKRIELTPWEFDALAGLGLLLIAPPKKD